MSLIAKIEQVNWVSTYPDQNGGEIDSADVLISIIDTATGNYANGNNCVVTYQIDDNGSISTSSVIIPGQSVKIDSGIVRESHYNEHGEQTFSSYKNYSIVSMQPGSSTPPANPGICNLKINFITVDKPESAIGAADAQITINATSSYSPIQYSIDFGATWQFSPTFTGLSGGLEQPLVKDSNPLGCADQAFVTIPTLPNLLIDDPSVTLSGGNVSRWNAAFNPIVFTYQRKDFGVINITEDTATGYAKIAVNATLLNTTTARYKVNKGDKIYLNASPYIGIYDVVSAGNSNQIVIQTPFSGNASGYVNINSMRPYYNVITRITYQDKLTGRQSIITSSNSPNNEGIIKADLSNFLQSQLRPNDESDYTQLCFKDDNLCTSYQIAYAEHYDDGTTEGFTSAFTTILYTYYVVYAAKQLGERYGGNLAAYVPFRIMNNPALLARWVTDFAEPAYSIGYPFDIGFIYSEDLIGLQLYCDLILLDINRNPLAGGLQTTYLLNEDTSFLLKQDSGKFIITDQTQANMPLSPQPGLNRLLINSSFPRQAYYINIALKYDDQGITHQVTQTQTIRIDDAVDDNSVYLRWIGLSGAKPRQE
ncbi:MAG: hypothetical protein AAGC65_08200 [Mucilaginibacter sp.]|uniref:hypothetical protein n=1 Tax=Mucilaginibacter sp. TaxID=1882438 RepID=UPI0031AAD1BA